MRRICALLALVAALLALAPAAASAKTKKPPRKLPTAVAALINDCLVHDGVLTHHYSATLLKDALADLPTDIAEYTTCADAIRQAELAEIAPARNLPGGDGDKDAQSKLDQGEKLGGKPVDLDGHNVAVGAVVLHGGSLLDTLPTPLLLVLVALIAIAGVPLTQAARRLVRARRAR